MSEATQPLLAKAEATQPPWARPNIFGRAPENSPFGLRSNSGHDLTFENLEDLQKTIAAGKEKLGLVWSPAQPYLVPPEEIKELWPALDTRERLLAGEQAEKGFKGTLLFGAILLWIAFNNWSLIGLGFVRTQAFGFGAILLFIFGLWPWWWGRRSVKKSVAGHDLAAEIPEARFDFWIARQKVRVIWGVLVLITLVGAAQFLPSDGIAAAGIIKEKVRFGENWRLLTGAFLHGMPLHFLMNAWALWFFGKRVEILASWPHFLAVLLFSILTAGWATVTFLPNVNSVGISGGIAGLLGFLLVFETLHAKLVPKTARRRLLGTLALMAVIGAIGFQFIDNAAHLGGLLGGMAYAIIVFPKSSSALRPKTLTQDLILGIASGLILVTTAAFAIFQIISN